MHDSEVSVRFEPDPPGMAPSERPTLVATLPHPAPRRHCHDRSEVPDPNSHGRNRPEHHTRQYLNNAGGGVSPPDEHHVVLLCDASVDDDRGSTDS